jgi:hypothetical protein
MADAPQKLSAFMKIEVLPLIDLRYRTISDRTPEAWVVHR